MGISSSKNNYEENGNMNLELDLNTICPIKNQFLYSNIESLSKCVDSVIGFKSNSASPSDIYKLNLKNPVTGIDENVIMKLFIVNDPFNFLRNASGDININLTETFTPIYPDTKPPTLVNKTNINGQLGRVNFEAQVYELLVYLEKIKKLLDYNICPYFVKVLGGNVNIPLINIWKYLFQNNGIEQNSFLRNILIIRFTQLFSIANKTFLNIHLEPENRPSINDNNNNSIISLRTPEFNINSRNNTTSGLVEGYTYNLKNILQYNIRGFDMNTLDNVKVGYILTEESKNKTFSEILSLIKILDYKQAAANHDITIYIVLSKLQNDLSNNTLTIANLQVYFREIENCLDSINDIDNTEISKIKEKILNIFNSLNTYLNSSTRDNNLKRTILNNIKNLRFFSKNGNMILENSIFQILIACYSLFLSGVAHNDLHPGNIFLEFYENPITINYVINNKIYIINTYCIPKIYDFDRSYVNGNDNNLLINNNISQNNVLLEPKDFVKILCYVNKFNINSQINNYISLVVNNNDQSERLRILGTFYHSDDRCFLRQQDGFNPDGSIKLKNADTQDIFNIFLKYNNLVKKFSNGMEQSIEDHVINNLQKYYYLNTNYFKDNDIISLEKIEKDILLIGNNMRR